MEIWKYIKDTDNKYLISNYGNIKSLKYNKTKCEKLLKPYGKNYKKIKITKNHIRKDYYIHRLVAETFIKNPNKYPCINHIDGNKQNNKVDNLEWCTYKHNIEEAFRLGLSKNKVGKNNGKSIEVNQYTKEHTFIKKWESMRIAEQTLNIRHIHECCKGRRKTTGGYIWKYAKEDERMLRGLEVT